MHPHGGYVLGRQVGKRNQVNLPPRRSLFYRSRAGRVGEGPVVVHAAFVYCVARHRLRVALVPPRRPDHRPTRFSKCRPNLQASRACREPIKLRVRSGQIYGSQERVTGLGVVSKPTRLFRLLRRIHTHTHTHIHGHPMATRRACGGADGTKNIAHATPSWFMVCFLPLACADRFHVSSAWYLPSAHFSPQYLPKEPCNAP